VIVVAVDVDTLVGPTPHLFGFVLLFLE
jgi:hypothetical protein